MKLKFNEYGIILLIATYVFCYISCGDTHNNVNVSEDQQIRNIYFSANKLFDEGKISESLAFVDSANLQVGKTSVYAMYNAYNFKTLFYFQKNDLRASALFADSALSILERNKAEKIYSSEYIHALFEKGHVLSAQGNFDGAYDFYLRAMVLAKRIFDTGSLNEYDYHIAMTLYKQSKYKKANEYFMLGYNAAATYPVNERPYFRMQEFLSNIGLCYSLLNMPDSALYYYDSSLSFIDKNGHFFRSNKMADMAKAIVYQNMATVMRIKGNPEQAEFLLKKSISINMQPGYDNRQAQSGKIKLAVLYMQKKNFAEMRDVLADVRASLDTLPNADVEWNWKDIMWVYYQQTGQYKKALNAYQDFVGYYDSTNEANKKLQATDILRDMKDREQQYKIGLLEKDNRFQHAMSLITIGFGIMSLSIVVLIFINYRKSRKNEKVLAVINGEINIQKAALEKSNREKDRILNVVVHDLRNPIGLVNYLADMMLMDDDSSLPPRESLEMIRKSSLTSLDLINELLGFGFDDGGKLQTDMVDVAALAAESVRMMRHTASQKNQALHLEVTGPNVNACLDKEKISRVISNLLANAIKFSAEGTAIYLEVTEEADTVLIKVIDSGIGIPENVLPQLFEMFTTSKRTGTGGEKSYGLGLSICKQIVAAHNGEIWVETIEGSGSSFYVRLPKKIDG